MRICTYRVILPHFIKLSKLWQQNILTFEKGEIGDAQEGSDYRFQKRAASHS